MHKPSKSSSSIKLEDGITMKDLIGADGVMFTINTADLYDENVNEKLHYDESVINSFSYLQLGDEEDIDYEKLSTTPFETLAAKMVNVTPDGKIKKNIVFFGHGEEVPEDASVTVEYNAYLEYMDEPYDSTYARKCPFDFSLGQGSVFPGLEICVKSMKKDERAFFWIHHSYGFGELGCLDRIPPKSDLLFDIVLRRVVNCGAVHDFMQLSNQRDNSIKDIEKCVLALKAKGNDLANRVPKAAVREYNRAVDLLEHCHLEGIAEQDRQQELLIKLYTNIAICCNKQQKPKKACTACNNIFNIQRNSPYISLPAKVYFNNAKALSMLGEYDQAFEKLMQAKKIEPNDPKIVEDLMHVGRQLKKQGDREKVLAKALMGSYRSADRVTGQFKDYFQKVCQDLLADEYTFQMKLGEKLTKPEIDFARQEAPKMNLVLKESGNPNITSVYVSKRFL